MAKIRKFGIYEAREQTFGDFLCEKWDTACGVLSFPSVQAQKNAENLRELLPPWRSAMIGVAPIGPSYVAEDGFPAEMSVNWSGPNPELRVLFDCSFGALSKEGHFSAPVGHLQQMADDFNISLSRLRQVEDIFLARESPSQAAPLWHSMAWRPGGRLVHKAYFGLFGWNLAERNAAVHEAMRRLGMGAAWGDACMRVTGGQEDSRRREVEFFALDLTEDSRARVKVYYRNHNTRLAELGRMAEVARTHHAERAVAAYRLLIGRDRADVGQAPLTCLTFRSGLDRADEATTYLRMPSLTSSDQEAAERTARLMHREGLPADRYHALVRALAPCPLESCQGIQELVSYRAAHKRGDVTTYFRFSVYPQAVSCAARKYDSMLGAGKYR